MLFRSEEAVELPGDIDVGLKFTAEPRDVIVARNSPAFFDCAAAASTTSSDNDSLLVSIAWRKNGGDLLSDPRQRIVVLGNGTLYLRHVRKMTKTPSDEGFYECVVTCGDGKIVIRRAEVTVTASIIDRSRMSCSLDHPHVSTAVTCDLSLISHNSPHNSTTFNNTFTTPTICVLLFVFTYHVFNFCFLLTIEAGIFVAAYFCIAVIAFYTFNLSTSFITIVAVIVATIFTLIANYLICVFSHISVPIIFSYCVSFIILSAFYFFSLFIMHSYGRSIHGLSMPLSSSILFSASHFSHPSPSLLSILHSLHVFCTCFLLIYILLLLFSPFLTFIPPSSYSSNSYPSFFTSAVVPTSSISPCFTNYHFSLLATSFFPRRSLSLSFSRPINFYVVLLLLLAGDVQTNPGPVLYSSSLNFSCLNIRSASSITTNLDKPAVLQQFLSDHSIDILALTETWLTPYTLPSTLNSLTPPGYSIIHSPRPQGKGGGLALILRSHLKVSTISLPLFTSFESLCVRLTIASSSFTFLIIYRPPSPSTTTLFQAEFSTLLEDLISSPSELIITGDFNIHVDDPNSSSGSSFLSLLDTFGLSQLVSFPTHLAGHTLDLLITRSTSSLFSDIDYTFPSLSDHYAVLSVFSVPSHSRPPRVTKLIRNIKSIDITAFSNDILSSSLHSSPPLSLPSFLHLFSTTLSSLIDKYAPLKTVSCPTRTRKPFITDFILKQKSLRSKLESAYRRNKTDATKLAFRTQAKVVSKLITNARRSYFRSLISLSSKQPKKLWASLDSLLSRTNTPILPTSPSPSHLATSFLNFFGDKIAKLHFTLSSLPASLVSPHLPPPTPPPSLSTFSPATVDEVRTAILSSSDATCSLDLIPTRLLKSCLDALLLPITTLINLSISNSTFPDDFKLAIVTPLHKNHSLPTQDLSSYRPISNLNFISKILERVIHNRLNQHLASFHSLSPFQSAYRKLHSTETALLRIYNDLLVSISQQKLSALVLLDLSAAFDTIDHNILLTRLTSNFGISGSALSLIASYLSNRSQSVSIQSHLSISASISTGVPQGSVLGPLLFCLYTTPLTYLFSDSPVSYHLYADDTQLYISFSASDSLPNLSTLSSTLDTVFDWFTANRLSVNPSKTEFLLVGTPQQRSKVTSLTISFQGNPLLHVPSCRNLGVTFDNDLSFKKHISSVCSSSFYHIRRLRQIRSCLDRNSAIILANSLVSSKLDYCNSLFYGLPDHSLHRLQLVQNALARVVVPTVRRSHHVSPTLRSLHWLPIPQRITYKIASITFKTLRNSQPSYLHDLLIPYSPPRTLRSSDKHLLTVPSFKSSQARRSFLFAAPTIWNSLPLALRTSTSINSFHAGLKTHLFPP